LIFHSLARKINHVGVRGEPLVLLSHLSLIHLYTIRPNILKNTNIIIP
jgi:hypothetical protein